MSTVSALTIPLNEVPTMPQVSQEEEGCNKTPSRHGQIHQHCHQKQEEVDQIPQERKETLLTSRLSNEKLLQHITTLSHLIYIPQRIQNHMNETKQQCNHTTSCAVIVTGLESPITSNMKSLKSIQQRKTPKTMTQTSYKLIPTN